MARIYISHSHQDKELARFLAKGLKESGNEVFIDSESIQAGSDWRSSLNESLKQSDVFLVLVSESSINSQYVLSEVGAARAYVDSSSNDKLFIPIIIGQIEIPNIIQDIQAIFGSTDNLGEMVNEVRMAIDAFFGRRAAEEQKRERRKQEIEDTAASYIQETIEELKEREEKLGKKADAWNKIGWGSLTIGVVTAVILLIITLVASGKSVMGWPEASFLALKSIIIVALLVASSKYAFTLAKSYMNESLKNADRIHAISFGKFFIQAFGDNVDTKEVKEVFQHWNISNSTSFNDIDADKFDPKIIEVILSVVKVLDKGEKSKK